MHAVLCHSTEKTATARSTSCPSGCLMAPCISLTTTFFSRLHKAMHLLHNNLLQSLAPCLTKPQHKCLARCPTNYLANQGRAFQGRACQGRAYQDRAFQGRAFRARACLAKACHRSPLPNRLLGVVVGLL